MRTVSLRHDPSSLTPASVWTLALALCVGLCGAAAADAQAPPPTPVTPMTLEDVLRAAREHNASIVALRLGQDVARAEVSVAGQRPNPDLTFEEARETPHEAIALSVPIETAGKRGRRIDNANALRAVTTASIAVAEADLRASVRRAFFTLLAADARVTLAQEITDLSRRALDAAEQRVREGEAPRLDVLQAQLALARVENDANAANAERETSRVELNTLLGRAPSSPLTLAGDLHGGVNTPPPGANVDIDLADRRLDEARSRVALAKAMQIPDVAVQGAMTYRSPPDFTTGWRTGFNITIPLFTRHRAEVVREELATKQAQAERDAEQQSVNGAIEAARAQVTALKAQADRNDREILPRTREVEALAEESYRAGQTNLTALLQALQTARDVRAQALQTALAYQLALADLERAQGTPLP